MNVRVSCQAAAERIPRSLTQTSPGCSCNSTSYGQRVTFWKKTSTRFFFCN